MSSPAEKENLEIEEGPRVLGIGLGLFFLILLWSFAFVGILAFSRYSSVTSAILFSLASLITTVALALPRSEAYELTAEEIAAKPKVLYDVPFIWRTILTVILGICLVSSGFSSLLKHAMEQVYAEPIRKRHYYPLSKL